MENTSPSWDSSSNEDLTKLKKDQRQAVSFVYQRKPACVSEMGITPAKEMK